MIDWDGGELVLCLRSDPAFLERVADGLRKGGHITDGNWQPSHVVRMIKCKEP